MIEKTIADHGIDRRRVFVTGLSAGGAMTAVMLATYPDVFAAGAIIAGLPYGTATNVNEAFGSMGQVAGPLGARMGRSRAGRVATQRSVRRLLPLLARDGGAEGGPPHGMRLRRTALTAR